MSVRIALVGMWRLVGAQVVLSGGGTRSSELGERPAGFLSYDRSGVMAVQIAPDAGRPRAPSNGPSPGEPVDGAQGYLAYAGTWSYDDASRTVAHRVEISLDPSLVGKEVVREAVVEGDRLILVVSWRTPAGEDAQTRLSWKRAS